MISLNTVNALGAQFRHMDIIEEQLFNAQDQLKRQRQELEDIMQQIIKEDIMQQIIKEERNG